jgi:uncharacterized protein YlzI (FlbEa/FlbD family)
MDYIDVQTLDGRHVLINPKAIVTIGGARTDRGQKVLTDKATCLVTLVDGKFVTIVESCDAIKQRLQDREVPR